MWSCLPLDFFFLRYGNIDCNIQLFDSGTECKDDLYSGLVCLESPAWTRHNFGASCTLSGLAEVGRGTCTDTRPGPGVLFQNGGGIAAQ